MAFNSHDGILKFHESVVTDSGCKLEDVGDSGCLNQPRWPTFTGNFKNGTTLAEVAKKLHPILVRAVAQTLVAIFIDQRYADKVIEQTLRQNPKAGSRDRAFIAETTYEIVRNYRLYSEILGKQPQTEADFWKIIGIYLSLNFEPAPTQEPQTGSAQKDLHQKLAELKNETAEDDSDAQLVFPDWTEFEGLNPQEIRKKAKSLESKRAIRESIPDWLDTLGARELGDRWNDTLTWLNRPAPVVLRTNRLKTTREALQQALAKEGVETQPVGDTDALVLERRQNVFRTKAFKNGLFELQDYSSQLVASFLAPEPGMRVVDACAGGGGKSLHLAALMENKGRLIALDTQAWKLDELRLRARRAGIANIDTRPIENRKVVKRLYNSADRLLLDVPCSGLGVLRRNPDSKWKLSPEHIENLRTTQQEILQGYCQIVKPGGRMVYATCSILPSENEGQMQAFLASDAGKNFRFIAERKILPQDEGFDGFYMALLERINPAEKS
ncbi:MAG: RsmB/NOP family class I SAM-dependent RNA methyltransferase [Lewinellaceae bacterium]|nr:RsmB/NOP family class I SAM-dependent RNA methyltransferase [Saprospiraceae bacterium]MCB9315838.1 RsmB/NOP family class I SAM-dependent RNA methyltransferase [Lewinellaceae bacterium]MCB9330633.1 RsmB/NOP family class I SAM-dependent RNA methyltransferase [Lewinellaceae bacterium]